MGQKDHLYMNFKISNEKMKNVSKVYHWLGKLEFKEIFRNSNEIRIYEELLLKNTYRSNPKVIIKISVP